MHLATLVRSQQRRGFANLRLTLVVVSPRSSTPRTRSSRKSFVAAVCDSQPPAASSPLISSAASETAALAAARWSPPAGDRLLATTPPRLTNAGIAVALYWLDSGSPGPPPFSFVARDMAGNTVRRWPAASAQVLPREYSVPNEIEARQYLLT
ncbi:MAG: hypothetical protein ACRDHX_10740, partial [Chloroflexota bacterium]